MATLNYAELLERLFAADDPTECETVLRECQARWEAAEQGDGALAECETPADAARS